MKKETKQAIKESFNSSWLIRLIKFLIGGKTKCQ